MLQDRRRAVFVFVFTRERSEVQVTAEERAAIRADVAPECERVNGSS